MLVTFLKWAGLVLLLLVVVLGTLFYTHVWD